MEKKPNRNRKFKKTAVLFSLLNHNVINMASSLINLYILHYTAKCGLVLLHGDGLGHEHLCHNKGGGADITAGTVT